MLSYHKVLPLLPVGIKKKSQAKHLNVYIHSIRTVSFSNSWFFLSSWFLNNKYFINIKQFYENLLNAINYVYTIQSGPTKYTIHFVSCIAYGHFFNKRNVYQKCRRECLPNINNNTCQWLYNTWTLFEILNEWPVPSYLGIPTSEFSVVQKASKPIASIPHMKSGRILIF